MKRNNNMIMLAYIGVIILSLVVKLFWNYTMWEAIVVGVTCSSACFAIADYFSSFAVDLKNITRLVTDSAKDVFELCTYFHSKYAEKILNTKEKFLDEDDTQKTNLKFLSLCRDLALDLAKSSEIRRDDATKKGKIIRYLEVVSAIFTICGFFLFFSFLIFPEILKMLHEKLDWVSVLSFAIILVTQYFSAMRKDKYFKELKRNEQFYDSMEKFFLCAAEEGGNIYAN